MAFKLDTETTVSIDFQGSTLDLPTVADGGDWDALSAAVSAYLSDPSIGTDAIESARSDMGKRASTAFWNAVQSAGTVVALFTSGDTEKGMALADLGAVFVADVVGQSSAPKVQRDPIDILADQVMAAQATVTALLDQYSAISDDDPSDRPSQWTDDALADRVEKVLRTVQTGTPGAGKRAASSIIGHVTDVVGMLAAGDDVVTADGEAVTFDAQDDEGTPCITVAAIGHASSDHYANGTGKGGNVDAYWGRLSDGRAESDTVAAVYTDDDRKAFAAIG